jgi:transcription elongation factor
MENIDLNELSVEELKDFLTEVNDAIAEAKARERAEAVAEKEARAERFRNELEAGDTVTFLYGSKNELHEGTVVRVSDKTVTVESDAFSKGKSYVHFDRFVEITAKAETEASEDENLEEAV